MTTKEHWDKIYISREANQLGWYEEVPAPSLQLISKCQVAKNEPALVVGAGVSSLIDCLVEQGHQNVIATDISEAALAKLRQRLGNEKASRVQWIVDDLTHPTHLFNLRDIAVWHDRAVLHFLLGQTEQQSYRATLKRLLKKGGYAIIAAFSLDGAKRCSGLDLRNYNHEMLAEFLGKEFKLLEHFDYTHPTPSGEARPYTYTLFQRSQAETL